MPPPPPTENNDRVTIAGTNPAAGAEVSEAVPAERIWEKFHGIYVTLVTDTTVISRTVDVIFADASGNELSRVQFATAIPASQTVKLHLGHWAVVPADTSTNHFRNVDPDLELGPTDTIKTVTANIQAGDDFGAPTLIVKEQRVHN